MEIAGLKFANNLVVSPMAGVTDRPFRQLCRRLGAGMAVSEMTTADPSLWDTPKSRARMNHDGEPAPIVVQIAGAEPDMLAEAARMNVRCGAQMIDINMGCPAKKVCRKAAGSALMSQPELAEAIMRAVVNAVDVPVTLKMRTGPGPDNRNAVALARTAERAGIVALAVHGRTRCQLYKGFAEYDTIREVVQAVDIPVFANGDVDSPEKAEQVLAATGAIGLYVGRAAQGRPWIFREIEHYLRTGEILAPPSFDEVGRIMLEHISALHAFYGEHQGVRIARKHIGWYLKTQPGGEAQRKRLMPITDATEQLALLGTYFANLDQAA